MRKPPPYREKTCERCSVTFGRRWSSWVWNRTRFCSIHCAKLGSKRRDPVATFEALYIPEPNSGCWLWTGTLHHDGYGQIRINNIIHRAHRLSFELHKGPIPDGLGVLHHCDNRPCVNPDHLYAGTEADNARDAQSRGRTLRGTKHANSILTEENVREIRTSCCTDAALARKLGVSRPAVRNARIGITWAHVK